MTNKLCSILDPFASIILVRATKGCVVVCWFVSLMLFCKSGGIRACLLVCALTERAVEFLISARWLWWAGLGQIRARVGRSGPDSRENDRAEFLSQSSPAIKLVINEHHTYNADNFHP